MGSWHLHISAHSHIAYLFPSRCCCKYKQLWTIYCPRYTSSRALTVYMHVPIIPSGLVFQCCRTIILLHQRSLLTMESFSPIKAADRSCQAAVTVTVESDTCSCRCNLSTYAQIWIRVLLLHTSWVTGLINPNFQNSFEAWTAHLFIKAT